MDEIIKCDHSNQSIQMEAIEQYFHVYKVVLTFGSVDVILKFDHHNESL